VLAGHASGGCCWGSGGGCNANAGNYNSTGGYNANAGNTHGGGVNYGSNNYNGGNYAAAGVGNGGYGVVDNNIGEEGTREGSMAVEVEVAAVGVRAGAVVMDVTEGLTLKCGEEATATMEGTGVEAAMTDVETNDGGGGGGGNDGGGSGGGNDGGGGGCGGGGGGGSYD